MAKLFLDANVVIDFLCERGTEFYKPAATLMTMGYNKEIDLCCSALTIATACYFMEKGNATHFEIIRKISDMTSICEVTDINWEVVELALSSEFKDIEDAIQYFSAKKNGADIIITRNKKDFRKSELLVFTPEEYLIK